MIQQIGFRKKKKNTVGKRESAGGQNVPKGKFQY